MKVNFRTIFSVFGSDVGAVRALFVHDGAVCLCENGVVLHTIGGAPEQGWGPYEHLPVPTDLERLFILAWEDARTPSCKVVALPTNYHPEKVTGEAKEPSCGMEAEDLYKVLVARLNDATEEMDAPHPNYPTNPSKKIKVRVVRPRAPQLHACPWCHGRCVLPWLGQALLCGSCGGTGKGPTDGAPSPSTPSPEAA